MRARRVDANLTTIAEAYRKLGCSVDVTNAKWDLTVGYGGLADCVEVKDGSKPPSRRKYTLAQIKFRETWTGGVRLIMGLDDVTTHVGELRWRHRALTAAALGRVVSASTRYTVMEPT